MAMLVLLQLLLMVAKFSGSDAAWCVCRSDVSSSGLQKTLDYACGAGADCTPLLQNGGCYQPNTVLSHCSYAVNSYYQRKSQAPDACDFSNTATLSNTDPSSNGCTFPPNPSAAGTSSSTATPASGTSPPGSGTPSSTFSPPAAGGTSTGTGTSTGAGGVLGGLGPSSMDSSSAGGVLALTRAGGVLLGSLLTILAFAAKLM